MQHQRRGRPGHGAHGAERPSIGSIETLHAVVTELGDQHRAVRDNFQTIGVRHLTVIGTSATKGPHRHPFHSEHLNAVVACVGYIDLATVR